MNQVRLQQLLDRLPEIKILVMGDYFLDKYLDLDRHLSEVSLETGLEAYQAIGVRRSPGAAGTVANNLRALDVGVTALSAIGDDGEGYELKQELVARGVDITPMIVACERFTPTYMKPMMCEPEGAARELNRIDIKNRAPLPESIELEVVERLQGLATAVHGVIVADQVPEANCGLITDRVRDALGELAQRHPDLIIAADSRQRIRLFQNIILKPNTHEALGAVGARPQEAPARAEVIQAGLALFRRAGRPVFITIGADGVLVFTGEGTEHIPGVPVSGPLDIVGAGDSVMAGIVASLCAGGAPREAALIGNLVASITVQQIGTTGTATRQQVLQRFLEFAALFSHRFML